MFELNASSFLSTQKKKDGLVKKEAVLIKGN